MTASTPVHFTLDGRKVTASPGDTVLAVARASGIEIPTLCHHPDLEPAGACRLCLVEVSLPGWTSTELVTSCLYPVAEGLVVATSSDKVRTARRQVLALLAAHHPGVEPIERLAREHGVDVEGLAVGEEADSNLRTPGVDVELCILCGLCTRVCEAYATSAIVTYLRGTWKAVGSFDAKAPTQCVGCGACAALCPTGAIPAVRTGTAYRIWERAFETAICAVNEERCSGCGACEEACPFSVAQVGLRRGGVRTAAIPASECRGCGACVGACPAGAIDQARFGYGTLLQRSAPAAGGAR
jgi:NADH dehydrogenase/NADH:ubiquinone oxidoreductase subunit G